jgi:hypothetical protein
MWPKSNLAILDTRNIGWTYRKKEDKEEREEEGRYAEEK